MRKDAVHCRRASCRLQSSIRLAAANCSSGRKYKRPFCVPMETLDNVGHRTSQSEWFGQHLPDEVVRVRREAGDYAHAEAQPNHVGLPFAMLSPPRRESRQLTVETLEGEDQSLELCRCGRDAHSGAMGSLLDRATAFHECRQ